MSSNQKKHSVFYVSDRTGKTAESIGQSLLSQFDSIEFNHKTFSFVMTEMEAHYVAGEIQKEFKATGVTPIVFSTLVDEQLQDYIARTDAYVISLFSTFIEPLEQVMGVQSSHTTGKPHEEYDARDYRKRINAIEYSMKHDDGVAIGQYNEADVILIGVSRSAKTPTCLYLALNFSLKAANYPLTPDDLDSDSLPHFLNSYREKIIGLTIRPEQLSQIRQQRRPGSNYAAVQQCQKEIEQAEFMIRRADIPIIDSSAMSIEEIAVNIVKEKKLLLDN